jgi:hypothetical protein
MQHVLVYDEALTLLLRLDSPLTLLPRSVINVGTIKAVISGMDESVDDFKGLWTSFSMNQLETTIDSLAETIKALKGTFEDCDIDALVGKSLVEDIMTAALGLVSGTLAVSP